MAWYCVQRTNIQNLKAIHNRWVNCGVVLLIVFKERIYKIWKQFTTLNPTPSLMGQLCSKNEYTKSESNSQLGITMMGKSLYCVQRTNIQNLKAIHNISASRKESIYIVFKERIYKIWKQFTTIKARASSTAWLCSKNEYTKSESNSQQATGSDLTNADCVQRTNIQNLKAIHNY